MRSDAVKTGIAAGTSPFSLFNALGIDRRRDGKTIGRYC